MSSGCDHAIEYIYQYLDDETSLSHSARIRLHLRRCSSCMNAYEFDAKLKGVIRERGHAEPPPDLFDKLRTMIHEEGKK
ncbi:MAG: zf-HC2 domain-containing protein, partial [Acidimicrobiia bacterium]|nr:zf-HC2 domain-containing protein [Acidimicrobiia bacterium]